jgi:PKHD-type hydroxylase
MIHSIFHNSYVLWEGSIPEELCDLTLKNLDWGNSKKGLVSNKSEVNEQKRRTDIIWENLMRPIGCMARMHISTANRDAGWNFDVTGQENTQLTRYRSEEEGFYDWHIDTSVPENGLHRKLTCVVLLNDASEFEGGMLEIEGIDQQPALVKKGSIIVFPAFLPHRVTPVTKGVRYTAVTWAIGPAFR